MCHSLFKSYHGEEILIEYPFNYMNVSFTAI